MHNNEINVTNGEFDKLMEEAEKLGKRHVEALKEQVKRQSEK